MLDNSVRQVVDKSWDELWSGGITNPIVVSDVLGTILMIAQTTEAQAWTDLAASADSGDSRAVAEAIGSVRRAYGIEPGAEVEEATFWRDCSVLSRAMKSLDGLLHTAHRTDILGDIYEHILSKLSTAGHFGQFRTPKHIVEFMVEAVHPKEGEAIVDPACGSAGFLVGAADFRHSRGAAGSYTGYEIDRTIGRIAKANMIFHRLNGGAVHFGDGLDSSEPDADVILANPPFAGMISEEAAAGFRSGSRKTELLFLEAIAGRLKEGGRAAVIVPMGVLTGSSRSAQWVRELLVKGNSLQAVIELPSGVFRPYTDVKTGILIWERKMPSNQIKMIRIENDGYSLDSRRVRVDRNDIPYALDLLNSKAAPSIPSAEVTIDEIVSAKYNLSPSRYIDSDFGAVRTEHPDMSRVVADIETSMQKLAAQLNNIKEMIDG